MVTVQDDVEYAKRGFRVLKTGREIQFRGRYS
jgi:hypothetical protein